MRRTVVLSCLLLTGCVRQDTEILSRVGRKLADRVQTASSGIQDRLPFKVSSGEPTMQERVEQRLRSDKSLAKTTIEVVIDGRRVELKGTVESDEQKRRAVDLAETTVGVERVTDSLQAPAVPIPPMPDALPEIPKVE